MSSFRPRTRHSHRRGSCRRMPPARADAVALKFGPSTSAKPKVPAVASAKARSACTFVRAFCTARTSATSRLCWSELGAGDGGRSFVRSSRSGVTYVASAAAAGPPIARTRRTTVVQSVLRMSCVPSVGIAATAAANADQVFLLCTGTGTPAILSLTEPRVLRVVK